MDTARDPSTGTQAGGLMAEAPYPQQQAFVLKLRRGRGAPGQPFEGLVEHVASGQRAVFSDAEQLRAWIAGQLSG